MWRPSRRDVLLASGGFAACAAGQFDSGWPLAQWPGDEDEMNPSAIPQHVQPAIPSKSSLYDPLVLFAETTLVTGGAVSPNTAALANPHAMPMELLTVRFRIHTVNPTGTGQSVSGLGVGVKMDMGKIPMIDDGVPVSLLSTARDDSNDANNGYLVFSDTTLSPTARVYDYTWRLKYPLFIPPGAVVTPLFTHLTQTPFDVKVGITYFCRVHRGSAKTPAVVQVPWVSSYKSKIFDINSGANVADSAQSKETDIRNQFSHPIEVARIGGRVSTYVAPAATPANMNYESIFSIMAHRYLRLTMRGSRGDDIIRTPTLFGSVFPLAWKCWDLITPWYMEPGEFYDTQLFLDAFTGPTSGNDSARMQVGVSVVGYQRLNTRTLEGAL